MTRGGSSENGLLPLQNVTKGSFTGKPETKPDLFRSVNWKTCHFGRTQLCLVCAQFLPPKRDKRSSFNRHLIPLCPKYYHLQVSLFLLPKIEAPSSRPIPSIETILQPKI